MLGVFTAGRILNEKTARSQAIGGMIFGVGAALEEAMILDPRFGCFGTTISPNTTFRSTATRSMWTRFSFPNSTRNPIL
jgi:hypothetical protein